MRTKLLRALAHLKAARRHIDAARVALGYYSIEAEDRACQNINIAITAGEQVLIARYGKEVLSNIAPIMETPE